ncbi:MAG: PAS domain-containing protein, partial [Clostridia bacterium]|nr:PAS domain-containing protein [Clostridia bacterium]
KKTYYYAKRLSNGTVLRVSDEQMTIGALILRLIMPLFAALLAVIIISAILSSSIAKKIVKPINELDFHDPVIKGDYSEISPLLRRISRQNTLIELQMKELKRQQEEFLTVTGNMSEGLILIDSKAEVLSYNKSALRLLGVDDKGVGSGILAFCDSPELIRVVESVLNGVSCEPVISINGKELNILANPVSDEKKVSGAVLLILDVTERERRDTLRREFTSNVSHELKTPLTSIYGISDMMQNGLIRPEDTAQFAKNIHDETGRLITLVNDIIKLSQLDEGAVGLETEEVDLLACAKTVRTSLSAVAQRQGVTLSVQGESAFVTGIGTVIGEMIYNLCDNGIKYNREGGSVTVTVESIEGHPTVTVADTGIGIPKEHQERIFERFYRVDKSHSRSIGGTGLGLSIVKHGAAVHNATVRLESTEGEGTTVSIVF